MFWTLTTSHLGPKKSNAGRLANSATLPSGGNKLQNKSLIVATTS
jgi:hypothetical protein